MTRHDLIKRYYPQAMMLEDDFLWSFVPNNAKRRYGFPSSRKIKGTRRQELKRILYRGNRSKIYGIIENVIDKQVRKMIIDSINDFVDIKDLFIGMPVYEYKCPLSNYLEPQKIPLGGFNCGYRIS
jgi:hypothetical protein